MTKVSQMAETLIGSEIIKLAGEINERIKQGQRIYNFTIGDFDPAIFPIPQLLTDEIIRAYQEGHTNYPAANGLAELRQSVSDFLRDYQHLDYSPNDVLIAGGARPLIYALYQTIVDKDDKVIFPVPSWNNNHYCHLSHAQQICIETTAATDFMPTADDLRPHIQDAVLLALCSPLNPTGTAFTREALEEICDLVLEENKRRSPDQKPLYIMYDQIYWVLTYGSTQHFDPVSLRPELRPYTVYIDGLSKAFAATGVRVGWACGAPAIIKRMQSILGHVGAWSPKAEQIATARYLNNRPAIDDYLQTFKTAVEVRLQRIYEGLKQLRQAGFAVDAIAPQAAIYLTVQFDLIGKRTPSGQILDKTADITAYLLNEAGLAIVPFYAFGASADSTWYRLSVGTCAVEDIDTMFAKLRNVLEALS